MTDSARPVPRIFFVCQPTVSHYREPLLRELLACDDMAFDLAGRMTNSEVPAAEKIQEASGDILGEVTALGSVDLFGPLRWESGTIGPVLRGSHDAYVLEGRIYTLSTWVALLGGRVMRRKVILWGHGWKRPEGGLKARLRTAFYKLAHGHLFYGERAREQGIRCGLDPERIRVVFNSIYSEAQTGPVRVQRREGGREVLLFSSRLTPRHRLDVLAEAMDRLEEQDRPRLVVVGDGSERVRMERLFAEKGLDAEFLGPVYDYTRLRELYSDADLAVIVGGAGLNVVQALGFGVPVLADGGNPDSSPEIEAVADGETGLFYTSGDSVSLSARLQELLGAPEKLRELGESGLRVIRQRYTAERHAEAVRSALHHLLGR